MRKLESFTEDDLIKHKKLGLVLAKGKFEVEGGAVIACASLFHWYESLKVKMEDAMKQEILNKAKKKTPSIKKLGEK